MHALAATGESAASSPAVKEAATLSRPPVSIQQLVAQSREPLRFAFLLGSMLSLETGKEQGLLEATSRHQALQLLHEYLTHEVQVLELRKSISSKVETEMSKQQREYV